MNKDQLQQFLNSSQYTDNGILRYEWIFGNGFISTGGPTTTNKLFEDIKLPEGARVLDVGCGIGGGDVFLAEKFNAFVHGIDLADNCINIAQTRYADRTDVKFEIADVLTIDLPEESFDVIYSRDAILHIPQKVELFTRFCKWLKPGGKVVITDYNVTREKELWNDEFKAYMADRQYDLVTHERYSECLRIGGLNVDVAENITPYFVEILEMELKHLRATKEDFLKVFTQKDYDDLESGWEAKLVRCAEGSQAWGKFVATKPM